MIAGIKVINQKQNNFIASAIKNNDLAEYNYIAYKFLAYQNKKTLSHSYIKRAADLDENNPLYQYKAAIYAATEDYKVSLDYIEDALKQDPKNCLYLSHEASMLMRLDKDKEAMNSFRECLKNDPAYEMVWNNLAFHSRRLDGHQKAIEVMQEAVTGNPDSAYLWYQKALYEKEPDLIDEAVISLETSIDVKPELGKQAAKLIHKLTGRNYQGKYKAIVKGLMQELPFKLQGNHVYL